MIDLFVQLRDKVWTSRKDNDTIGMVGWDDLARIQTEALLKISTQLDKVIEQLEKSVKQWLVE